jgi:hypothetical protein
MRNLLFMARSSCHELFDLRGGWRYAPGFGGILYRYVANNSDGRSPAPFLFVRYLLFERPADV